eukprot:CAMPEP_0202451668 /NCGR_PEP_ID=MMETSP1360-20130828/10056_1 /ASSEMBLY_ACC=CAM_ASM_000848 /TAXON_ID=515479 /ORGANISM="Licmophora paradoxa, Strain CCMP2313" /LENGTH=217 /DNA_ID=CAMNT_0049070297 /DNA_START=59 /DNA_END=712 /DNA_ORIENTATION=+
MEVASPLPFAGTNNKRSFPWSSPPPPPNSSMEISNTMNTAEDFYGHQPIKRRRFDMIPLSTDAPQQQQQQQQPFSPFGTHNFGVRSNKRSRTGGENGVENYNNFNSAHIQQQQQQQAEEILRLKEENKTLQSDKTRMKEEHEKALHENKILKKLVAHQHNNTHQELEMARKEKLEADDKIRRMEQLILTLRYHLAQASTSSNPEHFMGFSPRPPDVY